MRKYLPEHLIAALALAIAAALLLHYRAQALATVAALLPIATYFQRWRLGRKTHFPFEPWARW